MTDTFPSVALGHFAMNTPDLERSREFYEDVLGWRTVLVDHPRHAPFRRKATLVEPSGSGAVLLLFEIPGYESGVADDMIGRRGRLDHVAFIARSPEEFDVVVERLIAAGATSGRVDALGPMRSVTFVDPHGGHHQLQVLAGDWDPDGSAEVVDPDLLTRVFGITPAPANSSATPAALAPDRPRSTARTEPNRTEPKGIHMRPTTRPRRLLLAGLVPLVALAACSSDSDEAESSTPADTSDVSAPAVTTAETTADVPDTAPSDEPPAGTIAAGLEDFCAVAIELTEQESLPTPEQLQRYSELAPDAIAEPAAIVVAAFEENPDDPGAIFGDPETGAALEELTTFEGEQCGLAAPQPEGTQEVDPDATEIALTASDYDFDFEAPDEAGRYSFVMSNDGAEAHLMILAQLEEGATVDEVLASEGEAGVLAVFESGVAAPGAEAVLTADLSPGRWVMVCPIPDADGVPHTDHGMVTEFTVS